MSKDIELVDENLKTRTWLLRRGAARAVMNGLALLREKIDEINARHDAAAKPIVEQAEAAEAALLKDYQAKVEASKGRYRRKLEELKAACQAESVKARHEFHAAAIWNPNPEMTRTSFPLIGENQYEAGSRVLTILETLPDFETR